MKTNEVKQSNYAKAYYNILYDNNLSCNARCLLIHALNNKHDWVFVAKNAAVKLGFTKKVMSKVLNELIINGFLKREKISMSNNRFSYSYTFSSTPNGNWKKEIPVPQKDTVPVPQMVTGSSTPKSTFPVPQTDPYNNTSFNKTKNNKLILTSSFQEELELEEKVSLEENEKTKLAFVGFKDFSSVENNNYSARLGEKDFTELKEKETFNTDNNSNTIKQMESFSINKQIIPTSVEVLNHFREKGIADQQAFYWFDKMTRQAWKDVRTSEKIMDWKKYVFPHIQDLIQGNKIQSPKPEKFKSKTEMVIIALDELLCKHVGKGTGLYRKALQELITKVKSKINVEDDQSLALFLNDSVKECDNWEWENVKELILISANETYLNQ